jgi:hypothetical protein
MFALENNVPAITKEVGFSSQPSIHDILGDWTSCCGVCVHLTAAVEDSDTSEGISKNICLFCF